MAHYKKRPKVKRYRRSFYSREMKLKKGIGIAVLVLAVLGIGLALMPFLPRLMKGGEGIENLQLIYLPMDTAMAGPATCWAKLPASIRNCTFSC
mgnify:CR=1 FL=1